MITTHMPAALNDTGVMFRGGKAGQSNFDVPGAIVGASPALKAILQTGRPRRAHRFYRSYPGRDRNRERADRSCHL